MHIIETDSSCWNVEANYKAKKKLKHSRLIHSIFTFIWKKKTISNHMKIGFKRFHFILGASLCQKCATIHKIWSYCRWIWNVRIKSLYLNKNSNIHSVDLQDAKSRNWWCPNHTAGPHPEHKHCDWCFTFECLRETPWFDFFPAVIR